MDKKFLAGWAAPSVRVDLYNALNAATLTGVNSRFGALFARPTSVMPARIIDVGGTYTF